jgi:hypothetical protein
MNLKQFEKTILIVFILSHFTSCNSNCGISQFVLYLKENGTLICGSMSSEDTPSSPSNLGIRNSDHVFDNHLAVHQDAYWL